MLSITNSLNDVKAKLINDYSYYGYATNADFDTALTNSIEDAKFEILMPYLLQGEYIILADASGLYDYIAAKDKVGLTLFENYVYRAEVYFSCAQFMKDYTRAEEQATLGDSESIEVEGYSRSVSGGITGKSKAISSFMKSGQECMANAGFKLNLQLQRGTSSLDRQGQYNQLGILE